MSSFAFMKLLETKASRYDRGMTMLTFGRIGSLYERVAERVPRGSRVLEVGCGTGGVTRLLLRRDCEVIGIDGEPSMLAVAEQKLGDALQKGQLDLRHLSVIEMDRVFAEESFDCLVCCLLLSELSRPEQDYALDQFCRILRPGGHAIIADEVLPPATHQRLLYFLHRVPTSAATFLLTQTTTRRANDVPKELLVRGFEIDKVAHFQLGAFQITDARRVECEQPNPS